MPRKRGLLNFSCGIARGFTHAKALYGGNVGGGFIPACLGRLFRIAFFRKKGGEDVRPFLALQGAGVPPIFLTAKEGRGGKNVACGGIRNRGVCGGVDPETDILKNIRSICLHLSQNVV